MKLPFKLLLVLLCWISICQIGVAEEKPWMEVRSPHFRLITNGSESVGRHMARQFELIRAVFASQFPGFQLEGNGLDILYQKVTPPIATFITTRRFYQRNHEDLYMSYAQGWALVHFLTFGPGMGNGQRLKQFFNALQRGIEQKKAFEETFGSFEVIQKQYDSYIF